MSSVAYERIIASVLKNVDEDSKSKVEKSLRDSQAQCLEIINKMVVSTSMTRSKKDAPPDMTTYMVGIDLPPKPPATAKTLYLQTEEGKTAFNDKVARIFPDAKVELDKKGLRKLPTKHTASDPDGKKWTTALIATFVWKSLGDDGQEKWTADFKKMKKRYDDKVADWKTSDATRAQYKKYSMAEAEYKATHEHPDLPKLPRTARSFFNEYCKAKNKKITASERSELWNSLAEDKKAKFTLKAEEDKREKLHQMRRFLREMEDDGKSFVVSPTWKSLLAGGSVESTSSHGGDDEDAEEISDAEDE